MDMCIHVYDCIVYLFLALTFCMCHADQFGCAVKLHELKRLAGVNHIEEHFSQQMTSSVMY
jgi:hypothetical protein